MKRQEVGNALQYFKGRRRPRKLRLRLDEGVMGHVSETRCPCKRPSEVDTVLDLEEARDCDQL